jgi:hypothetical protein
MSLLLRVAALAGVLVERPQLGFAVVDVNVPAGFGSGAVSFGGNTLGEAVVVLNLGTWPCGTSSGCAHQPSSA